MTIGVDLGDKNSCYCVLDSNGVIVEESRVGTTKARHSVRCRTAGSLLKLARIHRGVSRLLHAFGHEVIIANPRQVKLISASSRKDDRLDAQTLARLARVDPKLLRPIQHRSRKAQEYLMVIRVRAALWKLAPAWSTPHEDWLNRSASDCRYAIPTRWGPNRRNISPLNYSECLSR
jgi:hypothetical protein